MQRFKNNVSYGWLFRQELRFFRNFMRNWKKDVDDCDFFDIFSDNNVSEKEVKRFLKKHFRLETLGQCNGVNIKRVSGVENEEEKAVDFSLLRTTIDSLIRELWNIGTQERKNCRAMLEEWCDYMERHKSRSCKKKDPMESRMEEICRVLKLSDAERDILVYAAVRQMTCFDDFPVRVTNGLNDRCTFIAMAVDRPCSVVAKALSPSGKLRRYEVLDGDGDFQRGSTFDKYLECGDGDPLEGQFYKKASSDDALPWEYYGSLTKEHGDILYKMISAAKTGKRGVNILFYGAPGTGKTSFAKTLAKKLALDLYEIRQGDRNGERNSPQSRMAGIRICNEQVPRECSMIVIDEADQLLRTSMDFFASMFGGMGSSGSEKGVINSILDETKLPTIWISNAPARALDDSVRRRFDYSICFKKLDSKQRYRIWRNNIEKLNLEKMIPADMIEALAEKYRTNAGGISMVLENVKRMKPAKDKVESIIDKLMQPHCELMGIDSKKDDKLLPSKDYSLDGLNIRGEMDLEKIVEAVKRFLKEKDGDLDPDRPRMNLLLWGPPGTGKTEFIKYLGRETNAKVVVKMGSDLLNMYVGGTEANIKAAFARAEAEDAILFLDEIDGIVQDRSGAGRSWEVSQVNELLYQMENFKGVMVGATNFMDNLDAAIMRRFTFKLQFDYLDDAGKRTFFERMFKTSLSDADAASLAALRNLAPGDFRTVRQSMYYLGGDITNARRIAALADECSVKRDSRRAGRIGFGV